MLKKADEPKWIDDLADAKYKGSLVAEPRDFEFLMGIAKHKFKNDEKATALLRAIAANGVEFHKGHSQLTELLSGGSGKVLRDVLRASISRTDEERRAGEFLVE